jgi:predicted transcriptional regulator
MSKLGRKEFRTSVILTEAQVNRVREIARERDASIAWVLRQAIDRYLETRDTPHPNGMRYGRRKEADDKHGGHRRRLRDGRRD